MNQPPPKMNCCICGGEIVGDMAHSLVTDAETARRSLMVDRTRNIAMTPLPDGQVRLDFCQACRSELKETANVLSEELGRLRGRSYTELVRRIDADEGDHGVYWTDVAAPSGAEYTLQIMIFWDDSREKKNVRVIVSIAAGFMPPSDSFIMRPDGSFIGECASPSPLSRRELKVQIAAILDAADDKWLREILWLLKAPDL